MFKFELFFFQFEFLLEQNAKRCYFFKVNSTLVKFEEVEKLKLETVEIVSKFSGNFLQQSKEIRSSLSTEAHKRIFDVLLEIAFKAETLSPGSANLLCGFLSKKNSTGDLFGSKCFERHEVKELTLSYADQEISNVVYNIVSLGGRETKVVVDGSPSRFDKSVVELCDSYVFSGLMPAFLLDGGVLEDSKFVCIDGYVESTSEIHHLLEKASELKQKIILFVRGLSNEVINTLKVNYDRKTVICVPVIVNYDLSGVNLINDIAVVGGVDIISSLKGDLISSIDFEKYPRVNSVSFSNDQFLVKNSNSVQRVRQHLTYLLKKHDEESSDTVREILEKRMKSLNSSYIKVSLRNTDAKTRFCFDQCIRAIKVAAQYGVTKYDGKLFPTSTINSAKYFSGLFEQKISEIGCIII